MAVENATRIHQLVPSAPGGGEPASEGAGHLRTIKAAVKGSFPQFGVDDDSGVVSLDADAINGIPASITAVEDSVTALEASKQDKVAIHLRNEATTLDATYAGDIVYSGDATAYTYTLSDDLAVGDHVQVQNRGAGSITIALGGNVLHWFQGGALETGERTLLTGGVATIVKIAAGVFHIYGGGLS